MEGQLIGYQMLSEILKELGHWFLFSIVIALAQLWLIPFGYYLTQRPWTWVDLVGNGSLLFFATTTTSKATGESFKKIERRSELAIWFCIGITFVIVCLSVFAYALVISTRMGLLAANSLSPARVAMSSNVLAMCGIIFSAGITLYIRVNAK